MLSESLSLLEAALKRLVEDFLDLPRELDVVADNWGSSFWSSVSLPSRRRFDREFIELGDKSSSSSSARRFPPRRRDLESPAREAGGDIEPSILLSSSAAVMFAEAGYTEAKSYAASREFMVERFLGDGLRSRGFEVTASLSDGSGDMDSPFSDPC
jgi:hypothetical protein